MREPLFDGMREVRALWFDLALCDEHGVRQRILRHWRGGSRLYRVEGGYLLEWLSPQFLHCGRLDALPLCDQGPVLSSAPLAPVEQRGAAPGTVWLVRGAAARSHVLAQCERVDASSWLQLDGVPLRIPLLPHGPASGQEAGPGRASLRDILGAGIPLPSAEREAFLRQAAEAMRRNREQQTGGPRGASGVRSGGMRERGASGVTVALAMAAGLLLSPLGALAGLLASSLGGGAGGRPGNASGGAASRARRGGSADGAGDGGSPGSPLGAWLAKAAESFAAYTRISKLLGWRQAGYLRKTMAMFERGDLSDALRHAIPLDAISDSRPQRRALGVPGPRSNLNITSGTGGAMIGISPDVEAYLRQSYQRAFEQLDRAGRIDEAVFVLAELLREQQKAVDYLERHGRLRQAAQLAETLELPTELAVRLWWLAGDIERAVLLARTGRCQGAAVLLLEKKQMHEQAAALRKQWAQDLASCGALLEAVAAVWPLPDEHAAAAAWLHAAEQAGGELGVRALVRKLVLLPGSLADSEPAIAALLQAAGGDGAQLRTRLATELLALKEHTAATKRLAGALLRRLLPDRMAGACPLSRADMQALIDLAEPAGLKADLPHLNFEPVPMRPLRERDEPLALRLDEQGLHAIHDACRLADDGMLLALGEAGVLRINRHGRTLAHYPVAAHHLVLAMHGGQALALARRDSVVRISKLDLLTARVTDWIAHPLRLWASGYDGIVWNAVIGERLVAIDVTQAQLTLVWQVNDLPGCITAFAEQRNVQALLLDSGDAVQLWRYALPQRRLFQREVFDVPERGVWKLLPNPNRPDPVILWLARQDGGAVLQVQSDPHVNPVSVALEDAAAAPVVDIREGLLVVQWEDSGATWHCHVAILERGDIVATVTMPCASDPGVRMEEDCIVIYDRCGRCTVIDTTTSQVRQMAIG